MTDKIGQIERWWVDEREVNWRDRWVEGEGVSEKKDTAVSKHTHLSRSLCVVSSERDIHTVVIYLERGDV